MYAYEFRVVPLGPNWVIRSADDQVIYGYATRERACEAAQAAAAALVAEGRSASVLIADSGFEDVAA